MQAQQQHGFDQQLFRAAATDPWAHRLIVAMVDGLIWHSHWMPLGDTEQAASEIAACWCRMIMVQPERLEEYLQ